MAISRREFTRLVAGAGAFAAAGQLGRSVSVAETAPTFRALVGIFLFGGNDSWNMVVPTDSRYATYASQRGSTLALPQSSLLSLSGSAFGLHPSFAALRPVWEDGGLGVVLNTGTLFQPMDRALYTQRPDLRPLNLMSHSDEQDHWQAHSARAPASDGFMGRIADRLPTTSMPRVMSIAGGQLAVMGKQTSPLILSSTGSIVRNGYSSGSTDAAVRARQAAIDTFSDGSGYGLPTQQTAKGLSDAYAQAAMANQIVGAAGSSVDQYFKNPANGAVLTSDISRQLLRIARLIEARGTLGHDKQVFMASQGGYDTHVNQVAGDNTSGAQASLYLDLALAMTAFYNAMKAIGLGDNVTAFTMSDFGRIYRANAQRGTDHAWGGSHLVVGGALANGMVHGRYPNMVLGGSEDISNDGRWIPSIAAEEYLAGLVSWLGVAAVDLPYVFPNWSTWNGGGRGPVPLFG